MTHTKSKPTPATVSQLRDNTLNTLNRLHPSSDDPPSDAQYGISPLLLPATSKPRSNGILPATRHPPPTVAPMLPIPQPLAKHKLRPIPNTTRPRFTADEEPHGKNKYGFLSSSPSRTQDDADASKSPLQPKGIEQENSGPQQAAAPKYNDSRPAATFHTTSMAQAQAASTARKKTLGVRRSMTGWSSRGGQGFSVPSRAGLEP